MNTPRHPGGGRYSLRRRELDLLFAQWEEQLDCQLTHDERAALEWQRFPPDAAHAALAPVHSMTEYDALLSALQDLYDRRDGPYGRASLNLDGFPLGQSTPTFLLKAHARARSRLEKAIADYRLAEEMIRGVAKPQLPRRKLSDAELDALAHADR